MKPLARELIVVARDRHGLLTATDLKTYGMIGRARVNALDTGLLTPVHRGVYRIASHPDSFEQRCVAACLAAPEGAIAGRTAGRLMGLRKMVTDEVQLLARHAIHLDGVVARRTDLLTTGDVVTRGPLRLLAPLRLLCDLASQLDDAGLESVLEQMIDRRLFSISAARAAARRFAAPGRNGSARLGRVLDTRSDWLRPSDSDLELRLWRAIAGHGVQLIRQLPVILDSGSRVHLDLADPQRRWAIEVDHVTWHGGRLDAQRDKRRDRELAQMGWRVSRVTDDDVNTRLMATVEQLLAIRSLCAPRC